MRKATEVIWRIPSSDEIFAAALEQRKLSGWSGDETRLQELRGKENLTMDEHREALALIRGDN